MRSKRLLEQMGEGVPAGISAAEMGNRIDALENIISELDKVNAHRTQLVNSKADVAERASDYIVQVRAVIKGIKGADSSLGIRHGRRHKGQRAEEAEEEG